MSSSIALALLSGLLHATWNVLVKRTKAERGATVAVLTGAWLLSAAALPFVGVSTSVGAALPYITLAGLGEAAYVLALGRAYAAGDLALTYAGSRAAALVFVWPLSSLFFQTRPTAVALAASAVVGGGIALAAPRSGAGKVAQAGARWSVPWTLATGLSIGVYHTGYKGAAIRGVDPVSTFVAAVTIACVVLWLASGSAVRREVLSLARAPIMWVASAACAGSFLLAIAALEHAESGRVLGLRNSSVAFALVMATLLGERPTARQWAGLSILLAGVALLASE